jgi:peptide-methionine (S)-S-oxide reductase
MAEQINFDRRRVVTTAATGFAAVAALDTQPEVAAAVIGESTTRPLRIDVPEAFQERIEMTTQTETAILAGGCFWGMEQLLRRQPGVLSTRVGYTGGDVPNATYRDHGTHAEAIEIVFDPSKTGYRQILEFFFQIHDPTTRDRQGNDIGTSYRSAIFYLSDEQKRIAGETVADADASGLWPGRVVTGIEPAGPFWQAEQEHQDYLERYPHGYTCHFIRPGWKLPERG